MKAGKQYNQFKAGDLVLLKKHDQEKLDLKWEPNYRIIRLPTSWTAVIEHTVSGRIRRCNVGDLQKKHPHEDWQLKDSNVGRAAKFVNHPSNLPEVEYTVAKPDNCGKGNDKPSKSGHNLRKSIKLRDWIYRVYPLKKRKKVIYIYIYNKKGKMYKTKRYRKIP